MRMRTLGWDGLFGLFAVLLGATVRLAPTTLAGLPINDGGMFYTMIQELRSNGFVVPGFTSYNQLNIPFAYPPLALYAGSALVALGMPAMEVLRWLPAVASILAILAFYWLASRVLESESKAAIAAVLYALMPRSFSWYIMGGGLSRSIGILFLLLTCGAAWQMYSKPNWRNLALTIVCGAAAVLSHPETAVHTLVACGLIWVFRGRTRRGVRDTLLVGLGVLILTVPWWGTVLYKHGPAPFLSALHTGGAQAPLLVWMTFDFAQEPFATLLTALGLSGFAVQCIRQRWFLPIWTLVPFIIEPRSAPAIAALPLAMLGGIGIADFLVPRIASRRSGAEVPVEDWTQYLAQSASARIVVGAVILYSFFGAFAYDLSLAGVVVSPGSRAAMQWVQQNTPPGSRFVVLTGTADTFSDATLEWFPALSGRSSVNTLQGREWLLGPSFAPFMNDLGRLQECINQPPDCVEQWANRHQTGFDFIFVEQAGISVSPQSSSLLTYLLGQSSRYTLVFANRDVAIYQAK